MYPDSAGDGLSSIFPDDGVRDAPGVVREDGNQTFLDVVLPRSFVVIRGAVHARNFESHLVPGEEGKELALTGIRACRDFLAESGYGEPDEGQKKAGVNAHKTECVMFRLPGRG